MSGVGAHRRLAAFALGVGLNVAVGVPTVDAAPPSTPIIIHKVRSGEDYASLARRYYGDRFFELHLRVVNRLDEPLTANTSVVIPTLRRVRVDRAQSVADFAETHLQDRGRARYLMKLNGLKRSKIRKGKRLLVSTSLGHRIQKGESLKGIAKKYYRDASNRRVDLIRLYNKAPGGRLKLSIGAELRIPLDLPAFRRPHQPQKHSSRVVAEKSPSRIEDEKRSSVDAVEKRPPARPTRTEESPAPEAPRLSVAASAPAVVAPPSTAVTLASRSTALPPAKPSAAPRSTRKTSLRANAALKTAQADLAEGEFQSALNRVLEPLWALDLPKRQRVALLRVVVTSLVALDRTDEAAQAAGAIMKLEPDYRWDPDRTSPKVINAFLAATTDAEGTRRE